MAVCRIMRAWVRPLVAALNAVSKSLGLRTPRDWTCIPNAGATASVSFKLLVPPGSAGFQRTPTRVSLGTISFSSSSRFRNVCQSRDVPSGPSKAGNEPAGNWIAAGRHDDGDGACGLLGSKRPGRTSGYYHFHLEADQLCGCIGEALQFSFGVSALDDNVLALDVSKLTQVSSKCL